MKTYVYEDLFEDIPGDPANVLLTLPPEILEAANLSEGSKVLLTIEEGLQGNTLIIKGLS